MSLRDRWVKGQVCLDGSRIEILGPRFQRWSTDTAKLCAVGEVKMFSAGLLDDQFIALILKDGSHKLISIGIAGFSEFIERLQEHLEADLTLLFLPDEEQYSRVLWPLAIREAPLVRRGKQVERYGIFNQLFGIESYEIELSEPVRRLLAAD